MMAVMSRLPRKPAVRKRKHSCTIGHSVFEVDLRYLPLKELGKGAYGVVCSAHDTVTKTDVAIKKINNVFENLTDSLRTLREMLLLRHIKHENIIELKDIMLPDRKTNFKEVYLVYELMDTDLHQIIKSPQPLSNDHVQYFMFQLLRGVEYLHSSNILHRDLKPGNLLVTAACDLKIADFGLARTTTGCGEPMTEYVVTRWYRAPELLLSCNDYGAAVDVWSVGCIFAELLGRKPLFPGTSSLNQLELILQVLGSPADHDLTFIGDPRAKSFISSMPYRVGVDLFRLYPTANPWAVDLLKRMLSFDPYKRITAKEALDHPYFSGLYDPVFDPPVAPDPIEILIDERAGEGVLRETMWDEMMYYHPGVASVCL